MSESPNYNLSPHNMLFTKLPAKWIDGIPFGNGEMGVMMWGNGHPLNLSLDKMDFWEQRKNANGSFGPEENWEDMQKLIRNKDQRGLVEKYQNYLPSFSDKKGGSDIVPTRLPVPRMEIDFGRHWDALNVELGLDTATLVGNFTHDDKNIAIEAYLHSELNFFVMDFKTPDKTDTDLTLAKIKVSYDNLDAKATATMKNWGYLPLHYSYITPTKDHRIDYCYQEIPEDHGGLLIGWEFADTSEGHRLVVMMLSGNNLKDQDSKVSLMHRLVEEMMQQWKKFNEDAEQEWKQSHLDFWNEFWSKSALSIPDNIVENLYYIELYKLACNSRYGKYPTSLQGIWTLDGGMPPWCGDFHLDMNVQEAYWPIYASNHLDLGEPLYRVMSDLIPKFKKNCREFYNCHGIMPTCSIALNGEMLKGYYNTEIWPGNGAWLAHMYWLQWRYSKDKCFLKQKAFPMMKGAMDLYEFLLEKDESGEYILPLSSSPEFHENQLRAWGSNTSGDLAMIQWLTEALLESSKLLGLDNKPEWKDKISIWDDIHENLIYFPADYSGLMVFDDQPYDYPHRHMTHLFPLHPFHLISVENDDDDRFLIDSSLKNLRKQGNWGYTGWTLPWLSIMGAWANNSWLAYRWLRDYFGFIKDNTMHINGDTNGYGICSHVYEPMTLEAGFTFIAATIEMIFKSWGGTIRVAETLPASWHDIRFENLRAEGAFLVSASISEDQLDWIRIKSEVGGECLVKNTFLGKIHYDLDVYDMAAKQIILEFAASDAVLKFPTETDGEYLIVQKNTDIKATLSAMAEEKEKGMLPVPGLFAGKNWFGLQQLKYNPYLP